MILLQHVSQFLLTSTFHQAWLAAISDVHVIEAEQVAALHNPDQYVSLANPMLWIVVLAISLVVIAFGSFSMLVHFSKELKKRENELIEHHRVVRNQADKLIQVQADFNDLNRGLNKVIKDETSELKNVEQRLKLALKAANLGFYDWDLRSDATYFNDSFYTMLGYSPLAFKASMDNWFDRIHPEERKEVALQIKQKIDNRENFELRFRMLTVKNNYKWILSRGKIITMNNRGEPTRVIGVNLDITQMQEQEHKILEQALTLNNSYMDLEHAHMELKKNNEKLKRYSFIASHNIRKPLANILGLINLKEMDSSFEIDYEMLKNSVEEMDKVINEMHAVLGTNMFETKEGSSITLEPSEQDRI